MQFEYVTFNKTITTTSSNTVLSPLTGGKRYIVEKLVISVDKKLHPSSILSIRDSVNSKIFLLHKGDGSVNRPFCLENLLIARDGNLNINPTIANAETIKVYGHARIQG